MSKKNTVKSTENKKKYEFTPNKLALYAYQVCQCWNSVFVQAERMMEAMKSDNESFPWEEDGAKNIFFVERLLFVTTVNHSVEGIKKLHAEAAKKGDYSLLPVIKDIENTAKPGNIKTWRNMTEHWLDYMVGIGNKQKKYCSEVPIGNLHVSTTAAVTLTFKDKLFIGDIELGQLLAVIKKHLPFVREKTKEIFLNNYGRRE